jgi:glutamate dehydrogenase
MKPVILYAEGHMPHCPFQILTAMLSPIETDTVLTDFPIYIDPFQSVSAEMEENKLLPNKLVDQVIRTPGREPSPQPTHFSVTGHQRHGGVIGGNGHRVLRSATVGYIAPRFEGKKAQIAEGQYSTNTSFSLSHLLIRQQSGR